MTIPIDSKQVTTSQQEGVEVTQMVAYNAQTQPTWVVTDVPVVTADRQDQGGNPALAELLLPSQGAAAGLEVGLPVGVGLHTIQSPALGRDGLINQLLALMGPRIDDAGQPVPQSTFIAQLGTRFLANLALADKADIWLHVVTPTVDSQAPLESPLFLAGVTTASTAAPPTALVIDAHNLPVGTVMYVDNLEFAAFLDKLRFWESDVAVDDAASSAPVSKTATVVEGGRGDQVIVLGGEEHIAHGGWGDDVIGGQEGPDQLFGDQGHDVLFGGTGADDMTGGSGRDIFQFASATDSNAAAYDTITDFEDGDTLVFQGMSDVQTTPTRYAYRGSIEATLASLATQTPTQDAENPPPPVPGRVLFFEDGTDGYLYIEGAGTGVAFDGTLVKLAGCTHPPKPGQIASSSGVDLTQLAQGVPVIEVVGSDTRFVSGPAE